MPKVSIILTSYNHSRYICEAIDSVLNQTFTDFELIIWDDNSTDNSWELINHYADPRIKLFRNEQNKGFVFGVNKAISEIATGDYIASHHSDDVWELNKLEKQVAFLDAHSDIAMVFTWASVINEHGEELQNDHFIQENKTRWQWLYELFIGSNHLNDPSVLVRKQCHEECGVYHPCLTVMPDAEMWSRILIKYPIHVIQERLTKHRLFSDNSNLSSERLDARIRKSNEWNILRKNYLSIDNFEKLVAIFPSLERYRNSKGYDVQFLLAMACLYECDQRNAWQLAITWLFELFSDQTKRRKITELYAFSHTDLIRLTAEIDVYFIEGSYLLSEWLNGFNDAWNKLEVEKEWLISEWNKERDWLISWRDNLIAENALLISERNKERDWLISEHNKERNWLVSEKNRLITEKELLISERNKERDWLVSSRNKLIAEKELLIAKHNKERDWLVSERNKERNWLISQKDNLIAKHNKERDWLVSERNKERNWLISQKDNLIAEKELLISEMQKERDWLITKRDNALAERNHALEQRDNAFAERNYALKERDSALDKYNAIEINYQDIINSSSWQLTKPLRFIVQLFKRS